MNYATILLDMLYARYLDDDHSAVAITQLLPLFPNRDAVAIACQSAVRNELAAELPDKSVTLTHHGITHMRGLNAPTEDYRLERESNQEWWGKASIRANDENYTGQVHIWNTPLGHLEFELLSVPDTINEVMQIQALEGKFFRNWVLRGKTSNGELITGTQIILTNRGFDVSEDPDDKAWLGGKLYSLRITQSTQPAVSWCYELSNCFFRATDMIQMGRSHHRVAMRVDLGDWALVFRQRLNLDAMRDALKRTGFPAHTCTMHVLPTTSGTRSEEEADQIAGAACDLLSLAAMTFIDWDQRTATDDTATTVDVTVRSGRQRQFSDGKILIDNFFPGKAFRSDLQTLLMCIGTLVKASKPVRNGLRILVESMSQTNLDIKIYLARESAAHLGIRIPTHEYENLDNISLDAKIDIAFSSLDFVAAAILEILGYTGARRSLVGFEKYVGL